MTDAQTKLATLNTQKKTADDLVNKLQSEVSTAISGTSTGIRGGNTGGISGVVTGTTTGGVTTFPSGSAFQVISNPIPVGSL